MTKKPLFWGAILFAPGVLWSQSIPTGDEVVEKWNTYLGTVSHYEADLTLLYTELYDVHGDRQIAVPVPKLFTYRIKENQGKEWSRLLIQRPENRTFPSREEDLGLFEQATAMEANNRNKAIEFREGIYSPLRLVFPQDGRPPKHGHTCKLVSMENFGQRGKRVEISPTVLQVEAGLKDEQGKKAIFVQEWSGIWLLPEELNPTLATKTDIADLSQRIFRPIRLVQEIYLDPETLLPLKTKVYNGAGRVSYYVSNIEYEMINGVPFPSRASRTLYLLRYPDRDPERTPSLVPLADLQYIVANVKLKAE